LTFGSFTSDDVIPTDGRSEGFTCDDVIISMISSTMSHQPHGSRSMRQGEGKEGRRDGERPLVTWGRVGD
jgi:hypothetical protein